MHHIVSDGWSIGILIRELSALYGAFRAGEPSPLPELPIQYADYAAWQRGWLSGEVLEASSPTGRSSSPARLALELPTDRPRPPIASQRGGVRTVDRCRQRRSSAVRHSVEARARRCS